MSCPAARRAPARAGARWSPPGRSRVFEIIAAPIGQTGRRVGPSRILLICNWLRVTTAHEVPNAKLPPWPIWPWMGRRSACTRPPGKAPSSWTTVLSAVAPPGAGPNRIGAQCEPLPFGGIRRDFGDSAHRCAGARLAETDARLGQTAAAGFKVAVDPRTARGPVIGYPAAAEDPRPSAARPDDIGFVDACRAAAGEVDHGDPAGRIEVARRAHHRIGNAGRDRPDWSLCGSRQRLGHPGKHARREPALSATYLPAISKVPARPFK